MIPFHNNRFTALRQRRSAPYCFHNTYSILSRDETD